LSSDSGGKDGNGLMGTKARLVIAALLAATLGVVLANGATAQGPPNYTSSTSTTSTSTGSTTTTSTTQSNRTRSIHYSLRFKRPGKHLPSAVIGRVYCHSITCNLKAGGKLRIKGTHTTVKLGRDAKIFPYRKGRKVAGTLRLKIPPKGAKRIKKILSVPEYGKLRVDVVTTATGPTGAKKARTRHIKLFAR
jgi:hypothetical protein